MKYRNCPKNNADIVVFRGSDVAAGKTCDWMINSQFALGLLALTMVPVVVLWGIIAAWTGLHYSRQSRAVANSS